MVGRDRIRAGVLSAGRVPTPVLLLPGWLPLPLPTLSAGVIEYWSASTYRQPEEEVQFSFKLDTGGGYCWYYCLALLGTAATVCAA